MMSNIKIKLTDMPQLGASELEYNTFYYCVNDGKTYVLINTNTNTNNNIEYRAIVPISNTRRSVSICDIQLYDYKFIRYSAVNMRFRW